MEAELIVKSIMGLIAILAILIFILFSGSNKKKKAKNNAVVEVKTEDVVDTTDINFLLEIIKDKDSDTNKLMETVDLIIKHHGKIEKILGIRSRADFDIYMDIIYSLCKHPNTNKNLILKFDKELGKLNPEYKQQIGDIIIKGLNSRRV